MKVSFPLRQKLTISGAFADVALPHPQAGARDDDTEEWSVQVDESEDEDGGVPPPFADGPWGEHASRLVAEPVGLSEAIALQPEELEESDAEGAEPEEREAARGYV